MTSGNMKQQKYYIELTTDPVAFGALTENIPDEDSRNELEALIYLLRDRLHGKITEHPDRLFHVVRGIIKKVTGKEEKPITVDFGFRFRYLVLRYVEEDNVERYTYDFGKLVMHEITGEITPEDTLPYFFK